MKKHTDRILSIQTKIMLSMLSIVLLLLSVLSLYYYHNTQRIIIENYEKYVYGNKEQCYTLIEERINNIEEILLGVTDNSVIQRSLALLNVIEEENDLRNDLKVEIRNEAEKVISKYSDICGGYVVTLKGEYIYTAKEIISPPSIDINQIVKDKKRSFWLSYDEETKMFSVVSTVYHSVTKKPIGVVALYINKSHFEKPLDKIPSYDNASIYIEDGDGDYVYGKNPYNIILSEQQLEEGSREIEYKQNNKNFHVMIDWIKELDWYMICTYRKVSEIPEMIHFRETTLFIILAVVLTGGALIIFSTYVISKPIHLLATAMQQFSDGNFDVRINKCAKDEIGKLSSDFNKMAEKVKHLISSNYRERNLRQQAMIHALQMQINPHFLYNTLDIINWMSVSYGADNISQVVQSLAFLMRFALGEKEKICIEEELTAVDHYCNIQKFRHGDDLEVKIETEETMIYETIPRNIILPLLENSIDHGFEKKTGKKKINIKVFELEKELYIEVRDNGDGVDEATCELIKNNLNSDTFLKQDASSSHIEKKHLGIGLKNVHDRIRLYYGEPYGITLESKYGEYTKIIIRIPIEMSNIKGWDE